MIKKAALLLLVAFISLTILTGCAGGKSAPAGTAAEIADKIFAKAGVKNFGMSRTIEEDSDKYLFLRSVDYPKFVDSVGIIPTISIDTKFLVIVKAANKDDIEEIKTKLKENVVPIILVCDGTNCNTFSLFDVAIESREDVIFLTIDTNAEERDSLVEAFKTIQ